MAVRKPLIQIGGALTELPTTDNINIDAGDIASGTIATARLGSGTASATTFLAGDQSYKTPPYPVTSVNTQTGAVSLTAANVGAAAATDIQTFIANGSWSKPAGAKTVEIIISQGGGGGGSGRQGAASSTKTGGTGGHLGRVVWHRFEASGLPSSIPIVIGAGGTGGAAQTLIDTNGNDGNSGGTTTFGTYASATAINRGAGGIVTTANLLGPSINFDVMSLFVASIQAGGSSSGNNNAGPAITGRWLSGSGGGGGSGQSVANVIFNASSGGDPSFAGVSYTGWSGAAGIAGNVNGGNGTSQLVANGTWILSGGGGGGFFAGSPAVGGNGGNGGLGSGGGGGSCSVNGAASGAGGNGGGGYAIIITCF